MLVQDVGEFNLKLKEYTRIISLVTRLVQMLHLLIISCVELTLQDIWMRWVECSAKYRHCYYIGHGLDWFFVSRPIVLNCICIKIE